MSVRSFHSVFMATAVAGAALGCYLVSLRVASERAALEQVEGQIVQAQRDIRLLQTEIGTRGRLAQLERWNVRVLALSAPSADQILGDKFQLAQLVRPERRSIDAPVILASAPAPEPQQPLAQSQSRSSGSPLLHEAGLRVTEREPVARVPSKKPPEAARAEVARATTDKVTSDKAKADKTPASKIATSKVAAPAKKSADKGARAAPEDAARKLRTASADPLAPLPTGSSTAKGSRTQK